MYEREFFIEPSWVGWERGRFIRSVTLVILLVYTCCVFLSECHVVYSSFRLDLYDVCCFVIVTSLYLIFLKRL